MILSGNGCNFLRVRTSFYVTYNMSHTSSLLCGDIIIITHQAVFEALIETFPFFFFGVYEELTVLAFYTGHGISTWRRLAITFE